MNFTNFLFNLKRWKNVPAAPNAERVLIDWDVDKGSLMRTGAIAETVSINGANVSLTNPLPIGSRVVFAAYYNVTGVVLTTAVKLGIGIAGTPSAFLLSGTTMTQGTTQSLASADATSRETASAPIVLSAVDTNGSAAGTAVGTVKVLVIYEYLQPIVA